MIVMYLRVRIRKGNDSKIDIFAPKLMLAYYKTNKIVLYKKP